MTEGLGAFSANYSNARERFRRAAAALGWTIESFPIHPRGPDGEELALDVAISSHAASQTLVLSSGVHGVEGFLGSAVQVGLMEQWLEAPGSQPPVRCVWLHALNPYGFAWLRRCDENNVDLNRNFLLPHQSYAGSPQGYADLNRLLNPESPPSKWEPFVLKALWSVARHGMPALRQTIAAGQYEFPRGLFFGGCGPGQTHQCLSQHLPRWLNGSRNVVHLDFHTGLGQWANCKLLIDYPLTDDQRAQFAHWFGAESYEICNAQGISYEATGGLGQWCVAEKLAQKYLFACAEFGTYGPIRVLASLRSENRAHHWGDSSKPVSHFAKHRLKETFCPSSTAWRQRVLQSSFDLVTKAVNALTGKG